MKQMKGLALLLVGLFFLLSACNNGNFTTVRLQEEEMPPVCFDVVIQPLDEITRSAGKKELRFEIINHSNREIEFNYFESPTGMSLSLLKAQDGCLTGKRPTVVATASNSSGVGLAPGESKVVSVFPYQVLGRLGKGTYRFCCFYTFEDEPKQVYSSYHEFEL